nr:hypothetical protein [Tanacetum cinerariifolium]
MFESDWTMENVRDINNTELFGATGYRWTPQNKPQKILDLGSLLSKYVCKNKPDMSEKDNPVACDVINKLVTKSMTLPRLMRHNYMWDSEAIMKLFYDVTQIIELQNEEFECFVAANEKYIPREPQVDPGMG